MILFDRICPTSTAMDIRHQTKITLFYFSGYFPHSTRHIHNIRWNTNPAEIHLSTDWFNTINDTWCIQKYLTRTQRHFSIHSMRSTHSLNIQHHSRRILTDSIPMGDENLLQSGCDWFLQHYYDYWITNSLMQLLPVLFLVNTTNVYTITALMNQVELNHQHDALLTIE